MNLCPLCKSNHDQSHNIINYDIKYYNVKYIMTNLFHIALLVKRIYAYYVWKFIINIKNIYNIPDINKKKLEVNELGKKIIELNKNINEIINKFKIVLKNIIIYYNICNDYIQNYDMKMTNYEKIGNMNKIINEDILNDIKNTINDNNKKKN